MTEVDLPTLTDLENFLGVGQGDLDNAAATAHLQAAEDVVRNYCGGRGFTQPEAGVPSVDAAIGRVIVSLAARALTNPTQARRVEYGSYNTAPGSPASLSLLEQQVLNRFRRRAA